MSHPEFELNLKSPSAQLIDTVEHLHAVTGLTQSDWLDLLKINWTDYYFFRSGQQNLPVESFEKLSEFFEVDPALITAGKLDFSGLASQFSISNAVIPERFLQAAYGRLRSTLSAIDFLESKFGWRLKHDMLKHFEVSESSLQDPFSPISIRFITEICNYLRHRQFSSQDFFEMGTHTYVSNRNSLIGKIYSEMSDYREAFEAFARTLMPMFESNCSYEFDMLNSKTGVVTAKSNLDIASQLNVRYLGSETLCYFKAGAWASLTSYFGLPLPEVTHPQCEHRGDGVCRYVFDFSNCEHSSGRAQSRLA